MENTQLNDVIFNNKLQNELNKLNNKIDVIINTINNNETTIITNKIRETKKCNTYIKLIIVIMVILMCCVVYTITNKT